LNRLLGELYEIELTMSCGAIEVEAEALIQLGLIVKRRPKGPGRVRFYYCCASRDADQTTELVRIGFQPRRDPQPAAEVDPTAAEVQTEPLK